MTDRFDRPLDVPRRPWQRRIEVFSPKLRRRLTLFSPSAQQAWLLLEAEPAVKTFCERPAFLKGDSGRVIDFWVDRGRRAEFWLLDAAHAKAGETEEPAAYPPRILGLALRVVRREELLAHAVRIQNWARIVPYLVCSGHAPDPRLQRDVLARLAKPHQLQALEKAFAPVDLTALRSAIFSLLAAGKAISPDLERAPLGYTTRFRQAAR